MSPLIIVAMLLLAVCFLPMKKKPIAMPGVPTSSEPFSIRQQQLSEDAAAIAEEFRRAQHAAYVDGLKTAAAAAFTKP